MLAFDYPKEYFVVYWVNGDTSDPDTRTHHTTILDEEGARVFVAALWRDAKAQRVSLHKCQMVYEYSE